MQRSTIGPFDSAQGTQLSTFNRQLSTDYFIQLEKLADV